MSLKILKKMVRLPGVEPGPEPYKSSWGNRPHKREFKFYSSHMQLAA